MVALDALRSDAVEFRLPNADKPLSSGCLEGPSICCTSISVLGGRLLAVGTTDRIAYVWKLLDPNKRLPAEHASVTEAYFPLLTLKTHDAPVVHIKFGLAEDAIAAGCRNGNVTVWDTETGQLRRTLAEHTGPITSVDFMPLNTDSCMLVSASADRCVKLWDLRYKRACVRTFRGHTDAVLDVKVSPHGRWIAAGGREGNILLWNIEDGRLLSTFNHQSHNHHDRQPFRNQQQFVDHQPRVIVPPGRGGPFLSSIRFHPQELLMSSLSVSLTGLASSAANGAASVKFWDLDHFECLSTYSLYSDFVQSEMKSCSDTEEAVKHAVDLRLDRIRRKSQTLGNLSSASRALSLLVPQTAYGTLQLQRKRHSTGSTTTKRLASNRYSMEFSQLGTSLLITDAHGCISSVLWEGPKQQRDSVSGKRNPAVLQGRRQLQNWTQTSVFEMVAPAALPNSLLYACVSEDYRSVQAFAVDNIRLCPPVSPRHLSCDKADTERYSPSLHNSKSLSISSSVYAQFPSACSLSTTDDSGIQSLVSLDAAELCRKNPSKRGKLSDATTITPVRDDTDVSPATTVRRIIPPTVKFTPATVDFVRSSTFDHDGRFAGTATTSGYSSSASAAAFLARNDAYIPARHTAARNLRRISSLQQLEQTPVAGVVPLPAGSERALSRQQQYKKMSEGSDVTLREGVDRAAAQRSRPIQSNGCRRKTLTTSSTLRPVEKSATTGVSSSGAALSDGEAATQMIIITSTSTSAMPALTAKPRRAVVVKQVPSRHQPSPEQDVVLVASPNTLRKHNNASHKSCFAHLSGHKTRHSSVGADSSSDSEAERNSKNYNNRSKSVLTKEEEAARVAMPPPPLPPAAAPTTLPRSRRKTLVPPASITVAHSTNVDAVRQAVKITQSPPSVPVSASTPLPAKKRQTAVKTESSAPSVPQQKTEPIPLAVTVPMPAPVADDVAAAGSHPVPPSRKPARASNPFVLPPTLTVAAPNPFLSSASMLMLTPPLPNAATVLVNGSNAIAAANNGAADPDAVQPTELCAAKQIVRSSPTALYILGERASNMHHILQALQSKPTNSRNNSRQQPVCDVGAAVAVALRLQDPIALTDFLSILADGGGAEEAENNGNPNSSYNGTVWNLTICAALLPEIYTLMQHDVQAFVLTACRAVRDMLKRFGPTLRETMRSPAPTGVDLTREARLEQCRQCVRQFDRIQMYLTSRYGRSSLNNNTGAGDDGRTNKNRRVRRECEQTVSMLREFLV